MHSIFTLTDRHARNKSSRGSTMLKNAEFVTTTPGGTPKFFEELARWLLEQLREHYREGEAHPTVECTLLAWGKKWHRKDTVNTRIRLHRQLKAILDGNDSFTLEVQANADIRYIFVRLQAQAN